MRRIHRKAYHNATAQNKGKRRKDRPLQQPEWDSTQHDLDKLKLSPAEVARRRLERVSKHQLPFTTYASLHGDSESHRYSQENTQPSESEDEQDEAGYTHYDNERNKPRHTEDQAEHAGNKGMQDYYRAVLHDILNHHAQQGKPVDSSQRSHKGQEGLPHLRKQQSSDADENGSQGHSVDRPILVHGRSTTTPVSATLPAAQGSTQPAAGASSMACGAESFTDTGSKSQVQQQTEQQTEHEHLLHDQARMSCKQHHV
eukprot:jgi/Chrzof1/9593/Cz04g09010.t1